MVKYTHPMSKRLQVVLADEEWQELADAARARGMSLSAWVRQTLREARRRQAGGDIGAKLDAVRAATRHAFPTGDIDELLADIGRGYLGEDTGG